MTNKKHICMCSKRDVSLKTDEAKNCPVHGEYFTISSLYNLVDLLSAGDLYYNYNNTVIQLRLHKSTITRKNLTTQDACSVFDLKGYIDTLIDDKIELRYENKTSKPCKRKNVQGFPSCRSI